MDYNSVLRSPDIERALAYVQQLLVKHLPEHLYFHSLSHTMEVLEAAEHIAHLEAISNFQLTILQLAALFHDTGYCALYKGHEQISIQLARVYLHQQGYSEEVIQLVGACIAATAMPQQPASLIQQIICDADLIHLSYPCYREKEQALRREWACYLAKTFTDGKWDALNLTFLEQHRYFTAYGQKRLEPRKAIHIDHIRERLLQT